MRTVPSSPDRRMNGMKRNEALILLYRVIFQGLLSTSANFFLTNMEFMATKKDEVTPNMTPTNDQRISCTLPRAKPKTTIAQHAMALSEVDWPSTT